MTKDIAGHRMDGGPSRHLEPLTKYMDLGLGRRHRTPYT
jgi:hypothetical protein